MLSIIIYIYFCAAFDEIAAANIDNSARRNIDRTAIARSAVLRDAGIKDDTRIAGFHITINAVIISAVNG